MRTKEITIKIKPKLRWFQNIFGEEVFYATDQLDKSDTNARILFSWWGDCPKFGNKFSMFNGIEKMELGHIKSLKTAKAVAELLYQG